jgi:inosine/xanthosine triphosphatase
MSSLDLTTIVTVGSANPAKINAVRVGFARVWPQMSWKIDGVTTKSGISAQPMSDSETIRGARNRATSALNSASTGWGVGLEGGLQLIDNLWFDCGWIVVIRSDGLEGIGSTARIITPPTMMRQIESGQELGSVVDAVFGTQNAKQGDGHFGLMTNNAITRTSGYADGVIMALSRFLHPELF